MARKLIMGVAATLFWYLAFFTALIVYVGNL